MADKSTTTKLDPTKPILLTSNTPHLSTLLSSLAHIHAHCILHDGQLATFLPPFSQSKIYRWWQNLLNEVSTGQRYIILLLLPVSSRNARPTDVADVVFEADSSKIVDTPTLTIDGEEWELAGTVSLVEPITETGPMRSLVEKLFTSPLHRRKGVARTVMRELERLAKEHGRWNIMLDTMIGSPAQGVYPRLGYSKVGEVKAYGIQPKTGDKGAQWLGEERVGKGGLPAPPGGLVDEVWFWKDLRHSKEL